MSNSICAGGLAPRVAAAACVLTLTACGGQRLTQTGLLENHDRLQPQPNHTQGATYVKPGLSATNYSKVIVEPVA